MFSPPLRFPIVAISLAFGLGVFVAPALCQGSERAKELNKQGIELQSTGKLKEACQMYRQAISLSPAGSGAGFHNNLALALKDLGEWKEAEAEARIALKLRPQRADYHFNLGIILQRQNRLEEAESAYKQALTLDAADTDCHFRLAQIYLTQEKFDAAVDDLKLALLLKPDRAEYIELMGDIEMKKGNLDDALYQYRQVMDLRGLTVSTVNGELRNKIEFAVSAMKAKTKSSSLGNTNE